MSVTPIQDAFPGEDLIGIEPQLLQQVDPGWLHRLSLFNGRALTAPALQSEQAYRAGRLAILGQCVTQGVVKGLDISASVTTADPILQVAPGYGISASGEDVTLVRPLRTTLSALQVIDPATGSVLAAFPDFAKNPANTARAGVLLLQPMTGEVSGSAVDSGALPQIVSGNLGASCDQDPEEFAFADFQIVDGVRLVLVAWPSAPATLALPSATPAASFRNRLAYTVFNAELALATDDRLPWDLLGVPLAIASFDASWKLQFIDRSSVVRAGGLPRSRYVLPAQAGAAGAPALVQPALAQARVAQFSEQIAASPGISSVVPAFALLPPCGVLPAVSMDFTKHVAQWLPSTWTVTAAPVLTEEVETALLSGMTAAPLDTSQPESVEVLVPLPDAVYDPNVLVVEQLDPAFQAAVDDAQKELAGVLQHRKAIEQEANALAVAITGTQQPAPFDLSAGLNASEIALRDAAVYTPTAGETFGTSPSSSGFASTDVQKLLTAAGQPPYTITQDGNGNPLKNPLPLFSAADLADMAQNGVQHFVDRINGKLDKANDLIDLAFLTTQSDIYRFRQYVLGDTGATALAVSPIVAQIATGESAATTAANLKSYLTSVLPQTATPTGAPAAPTTPVSGQTPKFTARMFVAKNIAAAPRPTSLIPTVSSSTLKNVVSIGPVKTPAGTVTKSGGIVKTGTAPVSSGFTASTLAGAAKQAVFAPIQVGTVDEPATPTDVVNQSPLVGAQLNLRTLTVAQRFTNPPSQEGLFYAIGNRLALLDLLADLEITIDDIPIVVDAPPPPPGATSTSPPPTSTGAPPPAPAIPLPTLADLRLTADPVRRAAVLNAVQTPQISAPQGQDPDEASLFSAGIHVLEQHSQLLRAIEARVQQYRDFLTLCSTALSNIETDLPQAQTLLAQLDNALAQARQDLAFTSALLNDEKQRIAAVNAQRALTLQTYVQVVAFTRPRTLKTQADVPSRQLVPGNIANPVPSCLQQSVAIPAELREIVSLLREAPVAWMPSVAALLNKLEHPTLLQQVALDARARASMVLQQPARVSTATVVSGVYAPAIAGIYSANQQTFTSLVAQRAAFDPVQLVNQSWAAQLGVLQTIAAVGDLIASAAVHAEIVNATSRLIQQVSSVATCLYARAGLALPIDRLAWAEFLRGPGLSIQLQSLAVLPNWNTQDYVTRQQTQMLVDWLFLQIDPNNASAVAFMSDVVRVAILLASGAPVNDVIGGAVTLASTPKVGGVVHLTLPSQRVTHGMYVQLFSGGVLSAQAVVSDLDSSGVRATVTEVYQTGVSLQVNDAAHFTAQPPVAPAVRAFDLQ